MHTLAYPLRSCIAAGECAADGSVNVDERHGALRFAAYRCWQAGGNGIGGLSKQAQRRCGRRKLAATFDADG